MNKQKLKYAELVELLRLIRESDIKTNAINGDEMLPLILRKKMQKILKTEEG